MAMCAHHVLMDPIAFFIARDLQRRAHEAAALVEAERADVVVRGDQPQACAAALARKGGHVLDQRRAGAPARARTRMPGRYSGSQSIAAGTWAGSMWCAASDSW